MPLSPIDTNEKCAVGQGEGYRGTWSMSQSGAECINWNSTSLRGRKFTARKVDASSLGLGNHNFCRYSIVDITNSSDCGTRGEGEKVLKAETDVLSLYWLSLPKAGLTDQAGRLKAKFTGPKRSNR